MCPVSLEQIGDSPGTPVNGSEGQGDQGFGRFLQGLNRLVMPERHRADARQILQQGVQPLFLKGLGRNPTHRRNQAAGFDREQRRFGLDPGYLP